MTDELPSSAVSTPLIGCLDSVVVVFNHSTILCCFSLGFALFHFSVIVFLAVCTK